MSILVVVMFCGASAVVGGFCVSWAMCELIERAEFQARSRAADAYAANNVLDQVCREKGDLNARYAALEQERDALQERVRELSRTSLLWYIRRRQDVATRPLSVELWYSRDESINRLAEDAGCWYDDRDHLILLDRWKADHPEASAGAQHETPTL